MKFGKIMAGAILAISAVGANAATYSTDSVLDLSQGTTYYGNAYSFNGALGNSFLDTFTFTIGAAGGLDSSLTSGASARTKAALNLDITSFDLFLGATKVASGIEDTVGDNEDWYLETANLAAGTYTLKVGGVFEGTKGGSYGGDINISPVPEPATWGMLGLGLAAVGVMSRRRKAS